MSSTALGAEKVIIFISDAHEKFYYEKLKEVRYQDVYHKALVYCLGISDDTRRNIKSIYDFKTGNVKTECLHEGWQTTRDKTVMRKLDTLVGDFPDTYKLIEQNEVSRTYSFLKSYVSYRKPRTVSTEQREWARQMMIAKNRVKKD